MVNWNYNKDTKAQTFEPIPVGTYRCRIEDAEEKVSQTGKDMIVLTLALSGQRRKMWYNIVFMPEGVDKNGNPLSQITDRNLKSVYDSFGIPEGDLNCTSWINKVGALKVKHEMVDGEAKAVLHYFINQKQAESLPNWIEPDSNNLPGQTPSSNPSANPASPEDISWED